MIVLASSSPRRAELLKYIYPDFTVHPSACDESTDTESPSAMVLELAVKKCGDVAQNYSPDDIIIAADTCVYINGRILGKPADEKQAYEFLSALSGAAHTVYTGVAVSHGGKMCSLCADTRVVFQDLSEKMIYDYISTGDPMDKAGGYGIQGRGALLVKGIDGDFYNVMGLPVSGLYKLLTAMGWA